MGRLSKKKKKNQPQNTNNMNVFQLNWQSMVMDRVSRRVTSSKQGKIAGKDFLEEEVLERVPEFAWKQNN